MYIKKKKKDLFSQQHCCWQGTPQCLGSRVSLGIVSSISIRDSAVLKQYCCWLERRQVLGPEPSFMF
jgi:hypothetical protein